jgi:hypothetical protein
MRFPENCSIQKEQDLNVCVTSATTSAGRQRHVYKVADAAGDVHLLERLKWADLGAGSLITHPTVKQREIRKGPSILKFNQRWNPGWR